MHELTRLAEWTVPHDEIDHLAHMSTLFYAQRAAQGVDRLLERIGAGPGELAAAHLKASVVDQHIFFRREQLVEAPLVLAGGIAHAHPERLDVYEEMANAASGELAAMFRLGVQLQHRATRTPSVLPAAWLDAARALAVAPPSRSEPRSLPLERMGADLTPDDFARIGIAPHQRREITAEVCDADGFFAPPSPRVGASRGPYNQGVLDQVWQAVPGFVWPALEMRALTLRAARKGDVLDTYAALLSVSHKIIHSGMWTFEAQSKALVSVVHQVNIFFNFETRRPQDMPVAERERLSRIATPRLMAQHAAS